MNIIYFFFKTFLRSPNQPDRENLLQGNPNLRPGEPPPQRSCHPFKQPQQPIRGRDPAADGRSAEHPLYHRGREHLEPLSQTLPAAGPRHPDGPADGPAAEGAGEGRAIGSASFNGNSSR